MRYYFTNAATEQSLKAALKRIQVKLKKGRASRNDILSKAAIERELEKRSQGHDHPVSYPNNCQRCQGEAK